ncbi:serpin family protein [Algivirga pacifica]
MNYSIKSLFTSTTITSLLFLCACDSSTEPYTLPDLSSNQRIVLEGSNTFALDLLKTVIQEENQNVLISPYSAAVALGMTANGAINETQQQILNTIGTNNLSIETSNESQQSLANLLKDADPSIDFLQANSIWSNDQYTINPSFHTTVQHYFDAEAKALDFSDGEKAKREINRWVENKTNDKIKDLIKDVTTDHVMFLVNAIYFKADWTTEFDKDATYMGTFYKEDGSTSSTKMLTADNYPFYVSHKEGMMYYQLPYGNEQYRLSILMPTDGKSLQELAEMLTKEDLEYLNNNVTMQSQTLHLPLFEIEYEKQLNKVLSKLGMPLPFSQDAAEFDQLVLGNHQLFISEVIQKTYMKVDEVGTEAAAATAVEIWTLSATEPTTAINRPFLFFISEQHTGAILFEGMLQDPSL